MQGASACAAKQLLANGDNKQTVCVFGSKESKIQYSLHGCCIEQLLFSIKKVHNFKLQNSDTCDKNYAYKSTKI
jgi:hypothetical protein